MCLGSNPENIDSICISNGRLQIREKATWTVGVRNYFHYDKNKGYIWLITSWEWDVFHSFSSLYFNSDVSQAVLKKMIEGSTSSDILHVFKTSNFLLIPVYVMTLHRFTLVLRSISHTEQLNVKSQNFTKRVMLCFQGHHKYNFNDTTLLSWQLSP